MTNQPTNHYPTGRQPKKPTNQPRENKPTIRLTDAELTKIKANQIREGDLSTAAYLRRKGLEQGPAIDRDFERRLLQAHVRIAGAVADVTPGQDPKEAALDEIKKILGELCDGNGVTFKREK